MRTPHKINGVLKHAFLPALLAFGGSSTTIPTHASVSDDASLLNRNATYSAPAERVKPDVSLFCFSLLGFYHGVAVNDAVNNPNNRVKQSIRAHFNNFNEQVTSPKQAAMIARDVSVTYTQMTPEKRTETVKNCLYYR